MAPKIDWSRVVSMRAAGRTWGEVSTEVGSTADNRRRNATKMMRSKRKVRVPSWVPQSLVAVYREHAAIHGEEAAASLARQLKRQVAA
jgi:hypothetical protein